MSAIAQPTKFKQISTKAEFITNSMKLYAENETIALYRNDESEVNELTIFDVKN